jgi:hypothetical protein
MVEPLHPALDELPQNTPVARSAHSFFAGEMLARRATRERARDDERMHGALANVCARAKLASRHGPSDTAERLADRRSESRLERW